MIRELDTVVLAHDIKENGLKRRCRRSGTLL